MALPPGEVREFLLGLLKEAVEGTESGPSWFIDPGPEGGLIGTIGTLSAERASAPLGGTSIAAHVHHVVFAMGVSAAFLRGERRKWDWASSWSLSRVSPEEWCELAGRLRAAYDDLRAAFEQHATEAPLPLAGAVGVIAHVACHLGAIRQKVRFAEEGAGGVSGGL